MSCLMSFRWNPVSSSSEETVRPLLSASIGFSIGPPISILPLPVLAGPRPERDAAQLPRRRVRFSSVLAKIAPMRDDTAREAKRMYEDTAFSLAAACGVARLLPSFTNTPGADLKATLLPPPEPVDRYNAALQLYHFLAQAVASALTTKITAAKSPTAHAADLL